LSFKFAELVVVFSYFVPVLEYQWFRNDLSGVNVIETLRPRSCFA